MSGDGRGAMFFFEAHQWAVPGSRNHELVFAVCYDQAYHRHDEQTLEVWSWNLRGLSAGDTAAVMKVEPEIVERALINLGLK